jgi:hypothetical protein
MRVLFTALLNLERSICSDIGDRYYVDIQMLACRERGRNSFSPRTESCTEPWLCYRKIKFSINRPVDSVMRTLRSRTYIPPFQKGTVHLSMSVLDTISRISCIFFGVWIFLTWDGVMWTGLVWLRIGTGGELLSIRY